MISFLPFCLCFFVFLFLSVGSLYIIVLFSVNERVLLIARKIEIRGVDIDQPYYHTIPTISLPQVLTPNQIEYLARNSTLFWADSKIGEIKRSGLTAGPIQTVIDTGIKQLTTIALDWISELLFIDSPSGIMVCNLFGEYCTILLRDIDVVSLAVDPENGRLFWIATFENDTMKMHKIETSAMDLFGRRVLVDNLPVTAQCLSVDLELNRLYWVEDYSIRYVGYDGGTPITLKLPESVSVVAATVYKDKIYYADDNDQSIHSADKNHGESDVLLRNSTGSVLSLRVYDPSLQKGNHICAEKKAGCEHLCLPKFANQFSCICARGYRKNETDPSKCIGTEEFLFYSYNWEIRGLALDGNNETEVLGYISRVSMASAIDFVVEKDLILWADSDHGIVTSIKRDGTNRKTIIEPMEGMESVPVDWLAGLAVDWNAENIYWSDPKRSVIQVARLNGSAQHILLSYEIGKPSSLAVDPAEGLLVWAGEGRLETAGLDGSNRRLLVNDSLKIEDVALDYDNRMIYWCDSKATKIERIAYDGSNRELLLSESLEKPVSLTLLNDTIFWVDT